MKRMLVNATQEEELRIAMVDGQKLVDLDVEVPSREQKKANIYKGRITRIEPSLDAAFVEYGADRHGFLPVKEISPEYFVNGADSGGRGAIRDLIREGQEIVVQVEKEERGNKGAALTTFLSLAGRFLVLMPNNPKAGGVSRRITGEDRDAVRESMQELVVPEGMGVIVRTAGVGRTAEELQWDTDYLLKVWEAIKASAVERPAPFLIYQESNAVVRALRDHFSSDVGEILVDDPEAHEQARQFMERVMPHNLNKIKLYHDRVPLFTRFQIESQIESAYSHIVELPSGGSIVIDHTEALLSIDINSARATKGDDIESTALNTNLEAAEEIARQLRIRDLGGLIVIDFIDMGPSRNQRDVETRLRDSVRADRARVQIGRISRFGLLEMSRQRLRPSLGESSHIVCPRCVGRGSIRSVESLALSVLRLMAEEGRKDRTSKVIAELPIDVATYLLNEKREWIREVEDREGTQIVIVPRQHLVSPHYQIRRVRDDAMELPENAPVSYQLPETTEAEDDLIPGSEEKAKPEEPAVSGIVPTKPAPAPVSATQVAETPPAVAPVPATPGLWTRIKAFFVGTPGTPGAESPEQQSAKPAARQATPASGSGDRRNTSRGGRNRGARSQNQQRGNRSERPRKSGSDNQGGRKQGEGQNRQAAKGSSRKTQGGQKRQQNRGNRGAANAEPAESQAQSPAAQGSSQGGEAQAETPAPRKRRRRRGGRGRRGGQNSAQTDRQAEGQAESQEKTAATGESPAAAGANGEHQTAPRAASEEGSPDTATPGSSDKDKGTDDKRPPRSRRRRRQRPADDQAGSDASPPTATTGTSGQPSPSRADGAGSSAGPSGATDGSRESHAPSAKSEAARPEQHGSAPVTPAPSAPGDDAPRARRPDPGKAASADTSARRGSSSDAASTGGSRESASTTEPRPEPVPTSPAPSAGKAESKPPFELAASPAPQKPGGLKPEAGSAPSSTVASKTPESGPLREPATRPAPKPAAATAQPGPVAHPASPRPASGSAGAPSRPAPSTSKPAPSPSASGAAAASPAVPEPKSVPDPVKPAMKPPSPAQVGPVSNPPAADKAPPKDPAKPQTSGTLNPSKPKPVAGPGPSADTGPEESR